MDDVVFSPEDYERVRNNGTVLSDFVAYELELLNLLLGPFGGLVLHGTIPAMMAAGPGYKANFTERAVVLKDFGRQGHAFELSDDPDLPRHKIYYEIQDTDRERMHGTILQSLTEG